MKKSVLLGKTALKKSRTPNVFHQKVTYSKKAALSASHVKGDTNVPLLDQSIGNFFDQQVAKFGDKEFITAVQENVRWSWREVQKRADSFANGLLKLGFEKGDRLGIWMPNNSDWIIVKIACAKAGIILVNINPAYRLNELEHALNLVGCKGLVIVPQFKQSNYIEMLSKMFPELHKHDKYKELDSHRAPALNYIICVSKNEYEGILRYDDVFDTNTDLIRKVQKTVHTDDAINIQFTSGTTGLPKGATLTSRGILNNGYFCGVRMGFSEKDVLCNPVPLYHCMGTVCGNLAAISHGARIVLPSTGFDATATLEAIHKEKCTAVHGVPTMFIAELQHPDFHKYDLSHLRTGIMAGSPCPIEVMKKVIANMNMKEVTIAYGMTETSPVSFQSSVDDTVEVRVETVGSIHPHVECKVVDSNGNVVPPNTPGELITSGYSVMKGYWAQEKKTKESVIDGFMYTGDLATIDEHGFCRIVGRSKDMIIRGGENIYPREIEEYIYQNPRVGDVSVIGVPDEKFGEQVCAWVIPKDPSLTVEELKAFCQDKIAHYKIPHYFMFVKSFPMTNNGKIQKYVMKQQSIEALGLQGLTVFDSEKKK